MNDTSSLCIGSSVEVHSAFGWKGGFEIAGASERGYSVRRSADRYLLPAEFTLDRLREDFHDAI